MLNEYFLETGDILASHIVDIFNVILNSGNFPESWTKGFIVPVYKKGDKDDAKNYRGITLLSNFGKLFTCILNSRITNWCENNTIISDAQFGFRKGRSTVDAIFILHSLIEHILNKNNRLYCSFIDMKQCFDSIYRNALWLKLYKLGLNGKILRIIRAMYQSVKSCIKLNCNTYTDFFDISIGLRQGEIISPIMWALFVEDLELYLQDTINSGININDICLILLLFADDMVLIGLTPVDLQNTLNNLSIYCDKWGLEVNVLKSKIMVFRKRGGLKRGEQWFYRGDAVEVVKDFNYVGNFNLNSQKLHGKGLKAMNILTANLRKHETKPKTALQLFDALVSSILHYGSEIWGFSKAKNLETLHLKFCKLVLGVKQSTSNVAVYYELGRYPLYICRYVKVVKYWLKIVTTENIIIKSMIQTCLDDLVTGKGNWLSRVKELLSKFGFLYIWENPHVIDHTQFISEFKQRIIDDFLQISQADLRINKVLTLYKNVKINFGYESYLDIILSRKLRIAFTKLRLSAHNLRIETGRYGRNRIDQNERLCLLCNTNNVEDEFHFMFKCEVYSTLRKKYIKRLYSNRPSMFKLLQIFQCDNSLELVNFSKYIHEALSLRNSLV